MWQFYPRVGGGAAYRLNSQINSTPFSFWGETNGRIDKGTDRRTDTIDFFHFSVHDKVTTGYTFTATTLCHIVNFFQTITHGKMSMCPSIHLYFQPFFQFEFPKNEWLVISSKWHLFWDSEHFFFGKLWGQRLEFFWSSPSIINKIIREIITF